MRRPSAPPAYSCSCSPPSPSGLWAANACSRQIESLEQLARLFCNGVGCGYERATRSYAALCDLRGRERQKGRGRETSHEGQHRTVVSPSEERAEPKPDDARNGADHGRRDAGDVTHGFHGARAEVAEQEPVAEKTDHH